MNFQFWMGNQGAVSGNAGRVANARIGLYGIRTEDITDGHWDDGPADDAGHYFICERYP